MIDAQLRKNINELKQEDTLDQQTTEQTLNAKKQQKPSGGVVADTKKVPKMGKWAAAPNRNQGTREG